MPNVLIVDDSRTMRSIIMRGLRKAELGIDGFVEAEDGLLGLRALANQDVDLILADVGMSSMSTADFVREVRQKHGSATPIVMIAGPRDENDMASLEIDGVLEKPFTAAQLSETLERLI